MPTPTYDLLASTTLATAASSVTFSSIDQSYGDLILVVNSVSSFGSFIKVRFNGSSSGYSYVRAQVSGSSAISSAGTYDAVIAGFTSNVSDAVNIAQIMDYAATDKHKSVLVRANATSLSTGMYANRWASTAAITSLAITDSNADSFVSGSTFNLYGIAKTVV